MIWEQIEQWFREILTGGIIDNLSGLFDSVNTEVAEIAGDSHYPGRHGTPGYST